MPTLEECTRQDGKIDLAKYIGVDDSNFAHPFGFFDEVPIDGANGGPIGARNIDRSSLEERQKNRDAICEYAGVIAYNVAMRELESIEQYP